MVHQDEKGMETMEGLLSDLETPKRFSPQQLESFTAGFSTSLGSGAFGDVFKGVLQDGVQVAVKVLKGGMLSDGVKDQFKAEVSVLGKIHHKHVVKLYGFCFEQNMKALIYEFMENESLEKQLYGNQTIAWETLCSIAVGMAKGLAYLHEDCQPCILHYDVKPANVLLDSKFSPKVGDFGLAKRLNHETTHISESRIRGTPNYMAPELLIRDSRATHKCDVFSFGISLFDIIGRRKHVQGEGEKWFPVQVWKKFKEEKQEEIMQECGIQEKDRKQAKRNLLIALQCVQFSPDDRPSMSRVVRLLEGTEEVKLPPNPFLYMGSSSMTQIEYPTPKSSPYVKASSSFTEEVNLHPNTFLMHMGSSSAVKEEYEEDNISCTTLGPWGSREGSHWNDGIFAGIKKIKVFKGINGNIVGIQVGYCGKDGEFISTRGHGDMEADTIDTIEFDYPSEYLMRVTGFYGYEFGNKGLLLVSSLCFFTNKKIYGPFGDERGIYFTSENNGKDGKIVGFHGREGLYLDAIGMHMEYNISRVTLGPWGGDGGDPWDDGIFVGIKKIEVFKGINGDVLAIQVLYCGKDGESISTRRHGIGDSETNTIDTIELDYPSEFLIRVTGFHGYELGNWGFSFVRSLCFFTNKKIYGPFGDERGTYFTSKNDGKDGKVVGFHGRYGGHLVAIGVHMEYNKDDQEKVKENDVVNVTRLKPKTVGPWGGPGGHNWDDRVSPGIKKIKIYVGYKGEILGMRIWYCGNDGNPNWSEWHGFKLYYWILMQIFTTHTIELDYPSEYLVRVTGSYGFGDSGSDQVASLCFFSNKKKYGPYGEEKGSSFSTEKDGKDGKVIGFQGNSSGSYLYAIGMHMETPNRFSHEELRTFTSNFSARLGSGGFGDVYKGTLHNGVQVAVKVLKGALPSDGVKDHIKAEVQFKAEVSVLGETHHKHVVKLCGFCFEQNMKALVYEFMENGSLDELLYEKQTIAWETLCNIAVGAAKGLAYLHEDCRRRILHCDIKPANILLDSKFSPKIGDFGLASLLNQDTTHITRSGFRGTCNYMAPELLVPYSRITHKCDVYSFGILLFDIIGRQKHVESAGKKWFPVQVWKKFKKEKQEEIMQKCDIQEKDRKQAKRILLIALQCVQCLPDDRPSMSRVARLLEGTEEVKLPPYPFPYIASSSVVTESV